MRFGTHMLAEEDDDWWVSVLPILENGGGVVTWAVCWNKGCFTSHLLSFDNNKVLKIINWVC